MVSESIVKEISIKTDSKILLLGGGYSLLRFLCEVKLLSLSWPSWPYSVPYGLGLSLAGFVAGVVIEKYRRN